MLNKWQYSPTHLLLLFPHLPLLNPYPYSSNPHVLQLSPHQKPQKPKPTAAPLRGEDSDIGGDEVQAHTIFLEFAPQTTNFWAETGNDGTDPEDRQRLDAGQENYSTRARDKENPWEG